ncbi:hypothetical protein SPAB_04700 [Salmonella enterica subsp. enterica serovar Paratyphi B str. SPB7]|uniref:Uncharacterized protein n=1 Tax=Salmonella paratyphi B (strain ATCC BAA-1250 / SPB7) TaxID=1016998 RepID=A0A6C6Z9I0_SALPB|nr:hypothetical protein SPAB_04700 [Salmonella enterica subsp. enterica serovar Paratyphi B str. SPB7]
MLYHSYPTSYSDVTRPRVSAWIIYLFFIYEIRLGL